MAMKKSLWTDTTTFHWTIRSKTRQPWRAKKAMSQCRPLDLLKNRSPASAKSYNRRETWSVLGGFFGRCRSARKFSWTSRCWRREPSSLFTGKKVFRKFGWSGCESGPGNSEIRVATTVFGFEKLKIEIRVDFWSLKLQNNRDNNVASAALPEFNQIYEK